MERSPVGQGCGSRLGAAPTSPPMGHSWEKRAKGAGKISRKSQGCSALRASVCDGGDGDHSLSVPSPSPIPARHGRRPSRGLTIWARQRQAAWSKSQRWRMGEQPAMARAAGTKRRWPRLAALRYGSSPDCTARHRRRRRRRELINMEQWDEGRRAAPAPRPCSGEPVAILGCTAGRCWRIWHDGGGGFSTSGTKGL